MNVLSLIKKSASDFDLIFNESDYTRLKVTIREFLLGTYLAGCPDPKYGDRNKRKRAERLSEFISSDIFKHSLKGEGGTVLTRKQIKKQLKYTKHIKNPKLREEIKDYYQKILKKIREEYLVLTTDDESLIHEFIHILMNKNGLNFNSINDNWKWNEGLVTYLEHYITNKQLTPTKDPMNKIYYDYAKKWERLLKNIKAPKERKKIIKKKYNKLKIKKADH